MTKAKFIDILNTHLAMYMDGESKIKANGGDKSLLAWNEGQQDAIKRLLKRMEKEND